MRCPRNARPDEQSEAIAAASRPHGGYITRQELHSLGVTRSAIENLIRRRYLLRVFSHVYAVGRIPTASPDRAHAPLLAVGPGSALGGWSAVNAYQNAIRWVEPFTVITATKASPQGVNTIRSLQLRPDDIRPVQNNLRAVTPALAVRQISTDPHLTQHTLIRIIDDFRIDQRTQLTHEQLVIAADRFPRGAEPLRAALDELEPEPTRSDWEQDWPPFAATYDLPPYEMNVHILTHRVDVLLDGCLVLMFDGWGLHGSRHAFEHDRAEMNEITAVTGLPVLRITHRQFHRSPARQADQIRQVHARESQRRD